MNARRWFLVGAATVVVGTGVAGVLVGASDGEGHPLQLTDDRGTLEVTVPSGWTDSESGPVERSGGAEVPRIEAAPDRGAYRAGTGPGMEVVFAAGVQPEDFDSLANEIADRLRTGSRCNGGGGGGTRAALQGGKGAQGGGGSARHVAVYEECSPEGTDVYIEVRETGGGRGALVIAIQGGSAADRKLILRSAGLV